MVVIMEKMTIKKFALTLMSVSNAISYLNPRTFLDEIVLNSFKYLWCILFSNTHIEKV